MIVNTACFYYSAIDKKTIDIDTKTNPKHYIIKQKEKFCLVKDYFINKRFVKNNKYNEIIKGIIKSSKSTVEKMRRGQ